MPLLIRKRSKKAGLPPGTLVHLGEKREGPVTITVLDYDEKSFTEKTLGRPDDCAPYKDSATVSWINLDGIHEVETLSAVGEVFGLHPLVMEDVLNTDQRPKLEDFDDYLYVVIKMLLWDAEDEEINSEQVSLVLGKSWVLSFQEKRGDIFDPVRERIRNSRWRIRKLGADYLMYALLDVIVDNYFSILERFGEMIEDLEDRMSDNPGPADLDTIHLLKRELVILRKSIWPLRELINGFQRGESDLMTPSTEVYLRDLHDHTIQVIDTIETFRDMLSGLLDLYLSTVSNRMNEVMKVLTIIATIFIPLSFFAGVYGMNFEYIPELSWHYGYFGFWGVMLVLSVLMFIFFRRKKWL